MFFLLDVVPKLDLSPFYAPYEQEMRGGPPFDPAMMVCLLLYMRVLCGGVSELGNCKLACQTEFPLAMVKVTGLRTVGDFKVAESEAFKATFVQRWALAEVLMGWCNWATCGRMGRIRVMRRRIHKAMVEGYMKKRDGSQFSGGVGGTMVTPHYQQDEAEEAALGSRRGDELPAELARREARLAKIEAAMRRLEAEAKAEADAERQRRCEADARAPAERQETSGQSAQRGR